MKQMKLFAAVTCLAGLLFAGNALAADTANLTVTATVDATCKITGGTLDFGTLDPTSGNPATVTNATAAQVTCTNGTSYTITDNGGLNGTYLLDDGSSNQIQYSLTYTGTGLGNGNAQDVSIKGDIAFAAYQTKPAGTYTDTVVLSVNP